MGSTAQDMKTLSKKGRKALLGGSLQTPLTTVPVHDSLGGREGAGHKREERASFSRLLGLAIGAYNKGKPRLAAWYLDKAREVVYGDA